MIKMDCSDSVEGGFLASFVVRVNISSPLISRVQSGGQRYCNTNFKMDIDFNLDVATCFQFVQMTINYNLFTTHEHDWYDQNSFRRLVVEKYPYRTVFFLFCSGLTSSTVG